MYSKPKVGAMFFYTLLILFWKIHFMLIMFHSLFIRTKIIPAASVLVSSIQSFLLPEYVLNLFPSPIPVSTALWRPLSSARLWKLLSELLLALAFLPSITVLSLPGSYSFLTFLEVCDSWIRNRALVHSGCCSWSGPCSPICLLARWKPSSSLSVWAH